MRLDASASPAEKRRWQLVRRDFYGPNNGIVAVGEAIVEADDESGHVVTLQHTFDDKGLLVVDAAGKPILAPVTTEYGMGTIRLVRRDAR